MFHRKNKRQKKSQEMLDIDLMEEIGYYQKKPQKKGLDQKIVIALVLVVVVAACVLFSPLFSVKKIEVEGASQFTTSELCEKIGLSKGDNLLLFSKGRAEKTLEKSPYIASAKLSFCSCMASRHINVPKYVASCKHVHIFTDICMALNSYPLSIIPHGLLCAAQIAAFSCLADSKFKSLIMQNSTAKRKLSSDILTMTYRVPAFFMNSR